MLQHRLATPVIQPRMYFFDKGGKPLVGGKIYSFKVGADEFKPTYRNSEFTAANQNPILLDQAGSALIYVRGSVQLKIYDKSGVFIEEKIVYQQQMQTQFFDNYGKALSNGKIWTYDYQSTIKKPSYANADDALLNPNPVILDEKGYGSLSIVGAYRLRVLNKNNVVVGDQDFKRPPAKVLTSRVYPLYSDENLATNFNTLNAKYSGTDAQEEIGTEFIALSPVRVDSIIYSDYPMEQEFLLTAFQVLNPIRVDAVIYSKYSIEYEGVTTDFGVASPTQQTLLLKQTMEPESISTYLSVLNPVRN